MLADGGRCIFIWLDVVRLSHHIMKEVHVLGKSPLRVHQGMSSCGVIQVSGPLGPSLSNLDCRCVLCSVDRLYINHGRSTNKQWATKMGNHALRIERYSQLRRVLMTGLNSDQWVKLLLSRPLCFHRVLRNLKSVLRTEVSGISYSKLLQIRNLAYGWSEIHDNDRPGTKS